MCTHTHTHTQQVELRDYYQNAMGQLDTHQKFEADQRIKEEERKTMLQVYVCMCSKGICMYV